MLILYGAQIDVLPQDLNRAVLRVTKVHGLIHQLIDESEMIANRILIESLGEICFKDLDQSEEELEYQGRVEVRPCDCHEIDVVMSGVHEGGILYQLDWCL